MINANLLDLVGNTPIVNLKPFDENDFSNGDCSADIYAKLEYYNPTGSIKDRPAAYIIRHLLLSGEINKNSTIIESSSGNFGIALAAICKSEGIRFICVIDPNILSHNEFLLRQYGAEIVKVSERDDTGGYLKTRLQKIQELKEHNPDFVWINQYANPRNAMAHYYGTGMEIYKTFADQGLDYIFIAASSGGTIAGTSQILKEQFPQIKVIAVDVEGSVIFSDEPKKRYIPGMGSSIRPEQVKRAHIDQIIHVKEKDIIDGCMELMHHHSLFVGGSSGAVYVAMKQFIRSKEFVSSYIKPNYPDNKGSKNTQSCHPKMLMLFPDRGDRYTSTVYNEQWVKEHYVDNLTLESIIEENREIAL
ncbi:2,3-diaminopropionate biosynthesis protein SbnA [Paraneptunicella aestuarii]|uniref:2,3-diaminopropionate biosynthesis protein SbnA n=1 Tax=Paraneptunicella aestuarii TaxID=2831148 RepID=UPI001E50C522|nr:2,3-diaminopropionate biosynthesis protein SbnA [Paraneptunicella aestuarii]UAA40609.1 2,3-diaminopropionate biosynthesis protein SbnA [Paraneptunicella aestuarii]